MKPYGFLAFGMVLLILGLVIAMFNSIAEKEVTIGHVWRRIYTILLAISSVVSALLCAPGLVVRIYVDAYIGLYDALTIGLFGALVSGLILITRRPKFLLSYAMCVVGSFLTLSNFLIR